MRDDPEYIGVATNEDGEVALCLYYGDGETHQIYIKEEDIIHLIAALISAKNDELMSECQTYH